MIDAKTVTEHAWNLLSQQHGANLGPNLRSLAESLAYSLVDAINAQLAPLLNPVVTIGAVDTETALERGTRIHQAIEALAKAGQPLILDSLEPVTNAPAYWKCRSPGCPERPAVTATEAPRCYTCDHRMQAAELEYARPHSIGHVTAALSELRQKIEESVTVTNALPAKTLRQRAKQFNFGMRDMVPRFQATEQPLDIKISIPYGDKVLRASPQMVAYSELMKFPELKDCPEGLNGGRPDREWFANPGLGSRLFERASGSASAIRHAAFCAHEDVVKVTVETTGPGTAHIDVYARPDVGEPIRLQLQEQVRAAVEAARPAGVDIEYVFHYQDL